MSSPADRPRAAPAVTRGNVIAGAVGSVLEWYDFAVYGYLAPTLGALFFPASDSLASLLAAFGVFAIGYAARPIGGAILGYVGDRVGRKPALMISVFTMGVATFAIGVMPTHARIGIAASLGLVALRVAAGLSVGGEYSGAIILLGEHAPPARRAMYAVWPELGCIVGFLLGSGVGAVTSTLLGPERMLAWGWRVPFLLGGVIAVWGILFRRQMTESPALEAARRTERAVNPVTSLAVHWRIIATFVGALLMTSIGFYTMFIYAASYLTERMHVSTARALDINTASLFVMLPFAWAGALASDRFGRKVPLYLATVASAGLSWPLWWLMNQEASLAIFAGQAGFGALFAFAYGGIPALMSELLPTRVRCTAIGIAYNVALGLFGGTAPLLATYLVARTADDFMPAYYVMAVSLISFVSALGLPETRGASPARQPDPA